MIDVNETGKFLLVYRGDLSGGRLSFNREALQKELSALNDGAVEISITNWNPKRSGRQNRLMWLWFTVIGKHIGYTPTQVKGIMQAKFLLVEEVSENTGEVFQRVLGTSELDTSDMTIFLDNVYRWSLEFLQLTLPQPNQQTDLWQNDL